MSKGKHLKSLLAMFCLGLVLLLCAAPSRADVNINLGGINFGGTLVSATPTAAVVATPYGNVLVPAGTASYLVDGRTLGLYYLQSLAPGTALGVNFFPTDALLQSVTANAASILLGNGSIISLPVPVVPVYTQQKTKVYVQLRNGNVVHVPLNAALNMQRAQGAIILTSVAPGTVVLTPSGSVEAMGKGHGHGNGHGMGNGQGHGNGEGHGMGHGRGHDQ